MGREREGKEEELKGGKKKGKRVRAWKFFTNICPWKAMIYVLSLHNKWKAE